MSERNESVLPDELTPAMADALGQMTWVTGPLARVYRSAGHPIPTRCEDEQAFVLYHILKLAVKHGDDWRRIASEELKTMKRTTTLAPDAQGHGDASSPESNVGGRSDDE